MRLRMARKLHITLVRTPRAQNELSVYVAVDISGKQIRAVMAVVALCVGALPQALAQSHLAVEPGTVQLMALANEARAAAGAAPLAGTMHWPRQHASIACAWRRKVR